MKIPKHIAFIMDGNGRWAKQRGKSRTFGHKAGFKNLVDVLDASRELGVEAVTCYAFSTENWNRPASEVAYLMEVPIQIYKENGADFVEKEVRVKFIGRRDRVPKNTLKAINSIEEDTKDFTKFTVVIAFDYGSYEELTNAVKKISHQVLDGNLSIDDIDSKLIENNLYTAKLPKIDLMIRTSGEVRLSNYLLWQLAYSELYFTDTYWPDFNKNELIESVKVYNNRNRRFGTIKED